MRESTQRRPTKLSYFALGGLVIFLSACGGGAGMSSVASISAPPPPPLSPSPPPPPPSVARLLAPVQTANPVSPVAHVGGPSFDNPAGNTIFPLMLTAVTANFGGDSTTISQGATLGLEAATRRLTLSIGNPALAVVNQRIDQGVSILPDGRRLVPTSGGPSDGLDYTRYGSWYFAGPSSGGSLVDGAASWVGGYESAAAALPTAGTATYSGQVLGLYSTPDGHCSCNFAIGVLGEVSLAVDFGVRSLSGSMTKMQLNDAEGPFPNTLLGDIAFTATLDGSRNLFAGSTRITSVPNSAALAATASGDIAGRFFGPSAQEVGAVWTLSDGFRRMIGSFAAKAGN